MEQYHGNIKRKSDADKLIAKLREIGTPEANDAASLLERNWRAIAARPKVAWEFKLLAQSQRKGACHGV